MGSSLRLQRLVNLKMLLCRIIVSGRAVEVEFFDHADDNHVRLDETAELGNSRDYIEAIDVLCVEKEKCSREA